MSTPWFLKPVSHPIGGLLSFRTFAAEEGGAACKSALGRPEPPATGCFGDLGRWLTVSLLLKQMTCHSLELLFSVVNESGPIAGLGPRCNRPFTIATRLRRRCDGYRSAWQMVGRLRLILRNLPLATNQRAR